MIVILTGVRGDLIVVLFSIFLMINDVKHIFMKPLAICISSLDKYSHTLYILKSTDGFARFFLFVFALFVLLLLYFGFIAICLLLNCVEF